MNESDENRGVFDVNPMEQSTATFTVEINYAEVCRLCMSSMQTQYEGTATETTVFGIHEDSIQFCDLVMALANVKVSLILDSLSYRG